MIWPGFLLGLLSGLHCLGMCGPIALAIPVRRDHSRMLGILLYNAGRVFTYSLLGAAVGGMGQGLAIAGVQRYLSLLAGIAVLLFLVQLYFPQSTVKPFASASAVLRKFLGKLFQSGNYSSLFSIGVLNGLLPCGMLYIALAVALATGTVWEGTGFMALFGLGTLPLMVAVSWFKTLLKPTWKIKFQQLTPVFLTVMAALLILRSLNLGIPYVSPKEERNGEGAKMTCCEKKTDRR